MYIFQAIDSLVKSGPNLLSNLGNAPPPSSIRSGGGNSADGGGGGGGGNLGGYFANLYGRDGGGSDYGSSRGYSAMWLSCA